MKRLIETVSIKNRSRGDYEDVDLFHGVDAATLRSIDRDWKPIFEGATDGDKPEDAHWDWQAKVLHAQSDPMTYELFSVEASGMTQGLLMAAKGGVNSFSRHPEHPRKPIVYLNFLATAPWNRPGVVAAPLYKGIGRVLVGTAVSLSIEEGFAGRIGLHSLAGAETFYRDAIGMTDLDTDPANQDLRYFELSETQALVLLGGEP